MIELDKSELLEILQAQYDEVDDVIFKLKGISRAVRCSCDVSSKSWDIDSSIDWLEVVCEELEDLICKLED
ncbi:MAG: hypothetical protein Q4G28_01855 [Neisseria sp.]|nr:hypothetical protein [Neisseria sp.]